MGKTSISVPEMQRLLGMKKVEAYWLVKQGRFKVILVGGKMRIMLDSFEEWYGSQFRYKKVNGPEPGQLLPASLTVPETAGILGLNPGSIYELIKNHAPFETFKVVGQTRIIRNKRMRHRKSYWTPPYRCVMSQNCWAYTETAFITW